MMNRDCLIFLAILNLKINYLSMKNIGYVFIFFIFILFVMCKNIVRKPDSTIELKPNTFPIAINVAEALSNEETPLLSNFSDEVSYIKLKTPPGIFVRFVRDVQISRDKIYIDDISNVMVFDMEGNFIKQIGRQGRGPDEYIHLRSFFVDEMDEDIIFYTGNSGNVLRFNSSGKVTEKLFSYDYADNMYSLNNILVFSGLMSFTTRNMPDNIFQFSTTNMQGHKIDSVTLPLYSINNWRERSAFFPGNFLSIPYNEFLLLYGYGEDTIFQTTKSGKIEPRYLLNFGKYSFPFEERYVRSSFDNRTNYIMAISSPFETSNNLWMKCALHKKAFILRYDKQKRKAFIFFYKGEKEIDFVKGRSSLEELGIVNDMDGGPDFFPKWSVKYDSTQLLISDIKAFNFKTEIAQEHFENREIKFPDKKAKLLELVNNLEEKDDYVLMIVKLK